MLRVASLLMMAVLVTPMVRDCCLPVMPAPPCHGARQSEDLACSSNQQAIAETKSANAGRCSFEYQLDIGKVIHSGILIGVPSTTAQGITLACIPKTDIYLHTGALLI